MINRLATILFVLISVSINSWCVNSSTQTIPYQGLASAEIFTASNITTTFTLQSSSGVVWQETQLVNITDGCTSVFLGSVTPLPEVLATNNNTVVLTVQPLGHSSIQQPIRSSLFSRFATTAQTMDATGLSGVITASSTGVSINTKVHITGSVDADSFMISGTSGLSITVDVSLATKINGFNRAHMVYKNGVLTGVTGY
jgi:hypothetical protein